jgi:hypothetical protein
VDQFGNAGDDMNPRSLSRAAALSVIALFCSISPAWAQGYLGGNLRPFAILADTTVTCTGSSVVTGDVGVSPGSAVVGFPTPCTVNGTIHAGNATAAAAQVDLTAAYTTLSNEACDIDLTGTNLGGLTLTPGTYCFSSSAALTGTLTLNALGDPAAVWIFQTGSTLTTAGQVVFINGGNPCAVQWRVGSAATIGAGSEMVGNILAQTAITLVSGADLIGRALARDAAVTLDDNDVSFVACGAGGGAGGGPPPFPGPPPIPPVPSLAQWAMIAMASLLALAGVIAMRRRVAAVSRAERR